MIRICSRCGRTHSGMCGIPRIVTRSTLSGRTAREITSDTQKVSFRKGRWSSVPLYPQRVEALYDIFDEDSSVWLLVELPGIAKEHITVSLLGDQRVQVVAGERNDKVFESDIELPRKVQPEFSQSYHNGVLDLRFKVLSL